jgi:hypothetical protein
MLTITPEALELIQRQVKPIFLELPKLISSCCFDFQEGPSVRAGEPRDLQDYEKRIIQNVTVFVPCRLPKIPLTIDVRSFFGIKSLVVDGWRYY